MENIEKFSCMIPKISDKTRYMCMSWAGINACTVCIFGTLFICKMYKSNSRIIEKKTSAYKFPLQLFFTIQREILENHTVKFKIMYKYIVQNNI